MAICENDPVLTPAAQQIIASDRSNKILAAASQSTFFQTKFPDILSQQTDHGDSRLTRFALVTDLCLQTFPTDISVSFKFFNRFIMFSDNYGVRDMMKSLLECSLRKGQLYRGLIAKKFVAKVARQIRECVAASVTNERLCSVWEILLFCIRNRYLKESVCVPEIAELLTDFTSANEELEDIQWELRTEFEFGDTNLVLEVAREAALLLECRSRFGRAEVAAIRFLNDNWKRNLAVERVIDCSGLVKSLKWFCASFPDHSVGLLAIVNFVVTGVAQPETSDAFLEVFAAFIVDTIECEIGSRTLRAFMIECLHLISALDQEVIADYRGLVELTRTVVAPFKRTVKERWGDGPSVGCRRAFPTLSHVVGADDWVSEISC
jgi:hypothetical protein